MSVSSPSLEPTGDRRVNDQIATAVGIAEIKVSLKSLEKLMEQQVDFLKGEQRDQERRSSASEVKWSTELIALKAEVLAALETHTHKDPAPHSDTLGTRLDGVEHDRAFLRGMLAVGAFVMPAVTGIVFKLLGV